jgi:hypothetical protein
LSDHIEIPGGQFDDRGRHGKCAAGSGISGFGSRDLRFSRQLRCFASRLRACLLCAGRSNVTLIPVPEWDGDHRAGRYIVECALNRLQLPILVEAELSEPRVHPRVSAQQRHVVAPLGRRVIDTCLREPYFSVSQPNVGSVSTDAGLRRAGYRLIIHGP